MSAVSVEGVSKQFRLYKEKPDSLKARVLRMGRIPFSEFWALRDVSLEVAAGETIGLMGANGSGKSTLLKCIAGILQPTSGRICTTGRLAALLELGAGFHPELTGRENVFLNASVLGLSRREVERRFDEIVAFSELEAFIDNQVKHYSSGMYVRLGFSVAVNVDPEVLLVDEVLAVGDEAFQRKCLDRVRQFQREGRTIVVVTHAADMVRQVCDTAAVLHKGDLVFSGSPAEAVRTFREHLLPTQEAPVEGADEIADAGAVARRANGRVRITSVTIEHPGAGARRYLLPGEPLTVRLALEASSRVDDIVFGLAVYDLEGRLVFGTNTHLEGMEVGPVEGSFEVAFAIDAVPLLDGTYPFTLGVHSTDGGTVYDWQEQQHSFEVMNPGRAVGLVSVPMRVSVSVPRALRR